jgi:hypothetical protein
MNDPFGYDIHEMRYAYIAHLKNERDHADFVLNAHNETCRICSGTSDARCGEGVTLEQRATLAHQKLMGAL